MHDVHSRSSGTTKPSGPAGLWMWESGLLQEDNIEPPSACGMVQITAWLSAFTGLLAMWLGLFLLGVLPGPVVFSAYARGAARPPLVGGAALVAGALWIAAPFSRRAGRFWGFAVSLCGMALVLAGGILALRLPGDPTSGYAILTLTLAQGFLLMAYETAVREESRWLLTTQKPPLKRDRL